MFPILQVGPLALQLPGLFLLAGIWLGTWLVDREAPRHKVSGAAINSLVFYGLIAGIIGARLAYASRYLSIYAEDPLSLLSLNPSTLAPTEGILAGITVALVLGQHRNLRLWPSLDALTPSLAALAVFVGIAHLSSGDAFGAPASLPWAIELWGALRHPTQVYEIMLAILAFAAVWRLGRVETFPGFLFFAWLALAAASRLFLEAFRGDSAVAFGGLRSAQVASLGVLALALVALYLRGKSGTAVGSTGIGPPRKAT
jgi:phosphatidylglycerol---prolipoprotein diacylglyceryl transferase